MWQFNEKMETLIAAKLDPNYSLWHSAANRTEMESCLFSWRQLGWAAAGAEPRIFILKAPLCRPALAGTDSLRPSLDPLCLFSATSKQKCRAENALCVLSSGRMCSWAFFLLAKSDCMGLILWLIQIQNGHSALWLHVSLLEICGFPSPPFM